MRFLKTFFRFFTIVTLCSTFTGAVFGDNFMDECSIYTNSAACTSKGCSWQDGKCTTNFAQTTNCDGYSDETACEAAKGCSWTTISGETKCFDTPAGYYNNGSGTQPCPPGDSENTYTYWETGMQSPLCRYYRTSCAEDEYFQWSTDGLSDQCKKCEAGKHIYRVDTYTHLCFNPSDNVNIGRLRKSTDYYWCSVTTELNPDGELEVNPIKKNYLGTDGDVYCLPNSYNFTLQMDTAKTFADGSTIGNFTSTYIVQNYLYDETSNELSSTNQSFTESISTVLNNHLKERFTFDSVTIKSKVDGNVKLVYNANTKKWNFGGDSNKSDALGKYQDNKTVPFILDASSAVGNSYTYYIVGQSYEESLTTGTLALVFGSYTTGTAKYGTKTDLQQLNRNNITCTNGKYLPNDITYTAYVDCKKTKTNLSCASATKKTLKPESSDYFVPPPSDARKQGSVTNEYTYVTVLVPNELDCTKGHYCASCEIIACEVGSYQDEMGQSSCKTCSTDTGGKYTSSAVGSDDKNDCYLTTTAGKYVKTTGAGEVDCACGGYCPGKTTVYYSSGVGSTTGGRATCSAGTYNGSTGSSASSACKTTNAGYYATADSCSQTKITAGCYGGAGSTNDCPNNCPADTSGRTVTSAAGSSAATDCYVSCASSIKVSNGTTSVVDSTPNYDGTSYPACKYDTNCNGGYYGADNVESPSCKQCDDGAHSTGNATTCTPCGAGKKSNTTKTGCDECNLGTYSTKDMTTCQPCPKGTYQDKTGQKTCISCKDGKTLKTLEPTSIFTTSGEGKTSREECCLKSGITLEDSIGSSTLNSLNVCWKEQQQ